MRPADTLLYHGIGQDARGDVGRAMGDIWIHQRRRCCHWARQKTTLWEMSGKLGLCPTSAQGLEKKLLLRMWNERRDGTLDLVGRPVVAVTTRGTGSQDLRAARALLLHYPH